MITKLQNFNFFDEILSGGYYRSYMNPLGNTVEKKHANKQFSEEDKIRIVIDGQSNLAPLEEICAHEGISIETFYQWTNQYLSEFVQDGTQAAGVEVRKDEDKFRIVIEGKSGQTSIAEICRREGISHDIFLKWCEEFLFVRNKSSILYKLNSPLYKENFELITSKSSLEVVKYFENYVDISSIRSLIVSNSDSLKLDNAKNAGNIISLQKLNDIRYINKYLEKVNSKLQNEGVFIGCLETFAARKDRMKIAKLAILSNIYFVFEFLVKRVLPKVSFTKKYYFDITKGNDRLLSKAEGLGRLVSCGFNIMDYKTIDGILYFVVKKIREPYYDSSPSYGPLYKMPRLGKNGKIIGVYKLRTMHPYSEYLQDYIVKANGYGKSGKPEGDFRIPAWGKFMRRIWLDELPQLYNFLKGDLKLVGIRPVSERYFQDIPKEMQKLRLTQKPGCIPPYVSLNREGNVMSVLQAEREYLEEKIRNPYTTDTKYFFKALYNIIVKRKRSA